MTFEKLQQILSTPLPTEPSTVLAELEKAAVYLFESSKITAECFRNYRQAKTDLEYIEAKWSRTYREEAAQSNARMTEAALASAVAMTEEVQQATRKVDQAMFELDLAKALHEALRERFSAVHEALSLLRAELRVS